MSTSRKLLFGFGLLLLILVGIGLFVSARLAIIERALATIMEVQEPATASAYRMSLNVSSTASAVRSYVHSGEPAMRMRAEDQSLAFDRLASGFAHVARLPASRDLGERIRVAQLALRLQGDSLMNLSDRGRTATANVAAGSDELRAQIERQLRARIDTRARDGNRKLAETERLEAELSAMVEGLVLYLNLRTPERRAQIADHAAEFRATLDRLDGLRLDDAERAALARVASEFERLHNGALGTLELAERLARERTAYLGAAARLEQLVEDGIHSLARNDLIAAQQQARRAIHVSVIAVLILLVAGILVGSLTALPVGRSVVKTEHDLRERMRELALTHERKDEFLGVLGHELRNPLAPLSNSLHVLESRQRELPPDVARAHDVMRRQVENMSRLVDDLLDVSRINQGKITLRREPVNLTGLVAQTLEDLQPLAESRGVALEVHLPEERLWVDADPTRVAQMVTNLTHNAIKYTQGDGRITIRLAGDRRQAVVEVADDGLGIPPGMLERIFEPFNQADSSLTRSQGGLGIGLALVRKLADLHGGSVTAESPGANRGSTFTLRLPLIEQPVPPAALAPAAAAEPVAWVPAPEPGDQAAGAARRVLVVDDNRDAAETLAEMLRLWGHDVKLAFDGREALDRAREWLPELVLLDIGLPGLDGYRVAEALRKSEAHGRALTLIALTGLGQQEDRARARRAGFDHHLTKPVRPATLRELLGAAGA